MNKIVDTKGKKCPLPIILTKKCIDESSVGDAIEVLLDNDVSKCNLAQYLGEIGLKYTENRIGEEYSIKFELREIKMAKGVENTNCPIEVKNSRIEPYTIVIKSDKMGVDKDGDELGEVLLRTYINALNEGDSLPKTIIFYNSGVKLLDEGSDCIETLLEIERTGVEIMSCGVCILHYDIDHKAGKITNIFNIMNVLAATPKIIYP